MEARTILLSLMTLIVVGIVVIIIYELTYGGGINTPSSVSPRNTSVELIDLLHDGTDYLKLDQALPLSQNQDEGIEYSFASWILINDFDYGANRPIIYVRGQPDLSLASPAVSLHKGRNEIHIKQDTYDKLHPGQVVIPNLPAGKLLHLVVSIRQTSMDVYVNGLLFKHLSLRALPLQNAESVYVSENGGWKGMIGKFVYYNYALSSGEVRKLASQKPQRDPNDVPPYPPYMDTSWWLTKY
jgi:hypothetical protein